MPWEDRQSDCQSAVALSPSSRRFSVPRSPIGWCYQATLSPHSHWCTPHHPTLTPPLSPLPVGCFESWPRPPSSCYKPWSHLCSGFCPWPPLSCAGVPASLPSWTLWLSFNNPSWTLSRVSSPPSSPGPTEDCLSGAGRKVDWEGCSLGPRGSRCAHTCPGVLLRGRTNPAVLSFKTNCSNTLWNRTNFKSKHYQEKQKFFHFQRFLFQWKLRYRTVLKQHKYKMKTTGWRKSILPPFQGNIF